MTRLESHLSLPFLAGVTIDALEKHWIINALRYYSGNKTQTAGALGISIRTLDNKLEKYEDEQIKDRDRAADYRAEKSKQLEHQRGKFITEYNGLGSANQLNGLQRTAKESEAHIQNGNGSKAGVRAQPAVEAGAEQTLPVTQRQEVQSVLQKNPSSHSHRKSR